MSEKPLKGILLLAFGGADSLESVEPFVKNVLKGRPVTSELVAKTVEKYKLMGGESPLLEITLAQAKAIEDELNSGSTGLRYRAYVGMRYWHPFIADTLKKMKEDGIEEAVAAIMSPFVSMVATGAYETDVESAVATLGGTPVIEFVKTWHVEKDFLDLVAGNILKELSSLPEPKDALVIFSSHSLPVVALQGDAYEMQVNQAAGFIMERVGKADYRVAYQSKGSGPRQWLGPQTDEVIAEAAKAGKKAVIVVPLGFAADHVETLYDIDVLFKEAAMTNGVEFRRTPSLNTAPAFIRMLAAKIGMAAEEKR
ncbi:MAG TPA: ferrochelatase [Deltaproteobacteria bacterium]|nr:MAG: ferrochelatase [Deltaproteobacteria bacterium GWA2_55_82]OGQ64836.1 MAG: ferrochelatase [Deltaproteobacteria bacterium RIFCSPLOWO2_02_FULL_55_12]OIJ73903.1 MAG: ferrochelatase [Deltaproteobacteria bacterium GWC2_55_46]HBG47359.1 ferrochelatase [Deltaproteobacteria bacterium]HCY09896.1 ferrochelatase [Deltaproteobacteria bacterium]